ncbi:MBL fold metallo-hydrolase [Pseudonocardia spinosispora]|uniref:MBL fold metallo-hydrolase n=1 Tax=Pseudonocardia spinosispora TaxID=103441 RepID=UPI001FE12C4F|nr:MBL fold metallo-hydrolase [Pseudonocardia spinosispora]
MPLVHHARALRSLTTTVLRATVLGATTAGMGLLARAAWGIPTAIGASATAIEQIATGSPRYGNREFRNTLPSAMLQPARAGSVLVSMLTRGNTGTPSGPVPMVVPHHPTVADELAVTWYGHSSALIEIDGRRVLVDPVWSDRASPSALLGPKRLHPVPAGLDELPSIDAVLISHDHYDHLDLPTVRELVRRGPAPFVVPLGVGAHLRSWGVPAERVVELDWNGQARVRELTLTCTEARHFSGRGLSRNTTLWSSWVIAGPQHGVFFGGDTGYTPAFAEIGARFGPFNLTLLPIGAYHDEWPDMHMTPEEAVRAHGDLGGGLLVPVHWATFNLGFHGWSEPVHRLLEAADRSDARVAVPMPGERFAVSTPPDLDWWSALGR